MPSTLAHIAKQPLRKPRTTNRPVEAVLRSYTVRGQERVRRYLAANPDILDVLREAPGRIRVVFGESSPLALVTEIDPEGIAEYEQLWIMVGCEPDVDEALRKLRQIDSTWLVTLPRHYRGKINVDTEFV